MQEIGKEVRETLVLVPASAYLRQDVYFTYACKNCKENEENDAEKEDVSTPVLKTPKEPPVIPGSFTSPEAIAYIMAQKFVMCVPLYRQEQERERQGLKLPRQTMSNSLLRSEEDWLKPVYDVLTDGW